MKCPCVLTTSLSRDTKSAGPLSKKTPAILGSLYQRRLSQYSRLRKEGVKDVIALANDHTVVAAKTEERNQSSYTSKPHRAFVCLVEVPRTFRPPVGDSQVQY